MKTTSFEIVQDGKTEYFHIDIPCTDVYLGMAGLLRDELEKDELVARMQNFPKGIKGEDLIHLDDEEVTLYRNGKEILSLDLETLPSHTEIKILLCLALGFKPITSDLDRLFLVRPYLKDMLMEKLSCPEENLYSSIARNPEIFAGYIAG